MNPAEQFLALTPERRSLAFAEAGTQRGVSAVLLEKDFWVCWLLGVLFADAEVDVSVSPAFVGADVEAFEALTSRTRRDAAMVAMQRLCQGRVRDLIAPRLEAALVEALGPPRSAASWLSFEQDAQTQSPTVYFGYPAQETGGMSYVRRSVKLELGSLTDQQPVGRHEVRPWVAEAFPALFTAWRCEVVALDLPRSFWEKATILHAEYHRPEDQPIPDRYSRHYADVARLVLHPAAASFLADEAMCVRIADWKSRVFARSWARYDLARPGTLRLAPPAHRLETLAADYVEMQPMFLREPPPFSDVVRDLEAAERTVNAR